MRDSSRIDETLELLNELWKRDSDLRFNQLIYILQSRYSKSNSDIGRVECSNSDMANKIGFDLFNLEDDLFIEFLRNEVAKRK